MKLKNNKNISKNNNIVLKNNILYDTIVTSESQRPRCKQRSIKFVALQNSWVFDPRLKGCDDFMNERLIRFTKIVLDALQWFCSISYTSVKFKVSWEILFKHDQ